MTNTHVVPDAEFYESMIDYINLKLSFLGYPAYKNQKQSEFLKIASPLLRSQHEKNRFLNDHLCPVDQRIQNFLDDYLKETESSAPVRIPAQTFIMDHPGLARLMSLPPDKNIFESDIITSYRIKQGVLHNPKNDRRTTQGVFHIAEGGLPVPDDKTAVPKSVFKKLLAAAFRPPSELLRLPFTATQEHQAELFASLLLRPIVCPAVEGYTAKKSMEIRFFAPGNLVSNLDFVESIFGNAGDPYLAENDAALDIEHWTGHTGCVILAPHLIQTHKKELGLPHYDQATERQRRDGMCWKNADELYNQGQAFKITCRDERGVIVTIIADNYFGYCKKEVKTQIGYAANLYGSCEEEHSGGAVAFASYDLGEEFSLDPFFGKNQNTYQDALKLLGARVQAKPEGYAVDKKHPGIFYVPEDAKFNLPEQSISWQAKGREQELKLLANHHYILPSGYKVHIKKQTGGHAWHLIGTVADGVLCHKPSTVSGGGKSEISKSIIDAMIQGPVFTSDFHKDMEIVSELLKRDYSGRFVPEYSKRNTSRPVLSPERSLGSVIKLFTLSPEYTDAYNSWLKTIPDYIKEMVLTVKRFYRPEWGDEWKSYFSVDVVNGYLGHELKFKNKKLVANYLRVGREKDGSWRIFRVRQDFAAAEKLQVADDITASIVVPRETLSGLNSEYRHPSVKMIVNCENLLFQRPDDAIYRGYDKQAEKDLSSPGCFLSNYEPLNRKAVDDIVEDAIHFDQYTDPMKRLLREFHHEAGGGDFAAASSHPRIVDGKPTKNPRYLQKRPDHLHPMTAYLAEIGTRLFRKISSEKPVYFPVNAVLPGRRNNPPDRKNRIPALAVYNPIHYQELPELFLDFVCSLTGKSPSTTGFGSEGALTKGPFNALWPVVDLNNAMVSFILTASQGFTSAAGYIGPNYRVDHDISLLMPEIWSRMRPDEQEPGFLIANGYLEKINDFEHKGRIIPAGILGYRITRRFVNSFLGRLFNNPNVVFTEEMLAPEKQSLEIYVEGIENIVASQKQVAEYYFNDGSVEAACPPLKALLHIMAHGHYEGKDLWHPDIRNLFTRETVTQSAWYQTRLKTKQVRDISLFKRHIENLENFLSKERYTDTAEQLGISEKLKQARETLKHLESSSYLKSLIGTLGADPFEKQIARAEKSRQSLSVGK